MIDTVGYLLCTVVIAFSGRRLDASNSAVVICTSDNVGIHIATNCFSH